MKTIGDVKEWLVREKLPNKSDAIQILRNEADFFKFQQIWLDREKYMKPMQP